jgi:hypothetical protein
VQGADIPAPVKFNVPKHQFTAQLEPGRGKPLRLKVLVKDVTEQEADARAKKFARELYSRFLLRFGVHVEHAEPPRCVHKSFSREGSRAKVKMTGKAMGKAKVTGRLTAILPASDLNALVRDVELRVIASQVPTAGQLYTAFDMYAIGLESQNHVVRFLVRYSALALAGLFKSGQGEGGQESIDALIKQRNPSIALYPRPTRAVKPLRRKKIATETLYTKLRNELIHAEERGCDPARAIAAIEAHIKQFQGDVALVFSYL